MIILEIPIKKVDSDTRLWNWSQPISGPVSNFLVLVQPGLVLQNWTGYPVLLTPRVYNKPVFLILNRYFKLVIELIS